MKQFLSTSTRFFMKSALMSLILCCSINSFGSHGLGGALTYQHLGGNEYNVRLTFYRDCAGIGTITLPQLTVSSLSCGVHYSETLVLVSTLEVSMLCSILNSHCNFGTEPGIVQHVFEKIILLPNNCQDWKLSYSSCCRNGIVSTIPNPFHYNLYLEAELDNLSVSGNNSPIFTNLPIFYACSGNASFYNPGVMDPDNDSLAYSLIHPKSDSVLSAPYLPPFSPSYPLMTNPPNGFLLDSITGQIVFVPDGQQVTILTMKVDEFRNGVKIGSTIRDVQLTVFDNCTNVGPFIIPPSTANGGTIAGNVITTCSGQSLGFQFSVHDMDSSNVLFVNTNVSSFPGATVTQSGVNPVILNFSWPSINFSPGNYPFIINASDDGCPITFDQSLVLLLTVNGVEAIATPAEICGDNLTTIQLDASLSGLSVGGTYSWTPTTGLSNPNIQNPIATVAVPTTYTVHYSNATCTARDTIHLEYTGDLVVLPEADTICRGSSVQLNAYFLQGASNPFVCNIYSSGCNSNTTIVGVGTDVTATGPGNTINEEGSPFLGYFHDGRWQAIYKASELHALGITEGLITELAFNISTVNSTAPYTGFSIKLGCTQSTFSPYTPSFIGGASLVYQNSVTPHLGWNTFSFSDAYYWNGTDDLLIEICYDNSTFTYYDHVFYSTTLETSVIYEKDDFEVGCTLSATRGTTRRPNIRLTTCEISLSGLTYTWTPANGLDDPTIYNPVASPTSTTTYTVTTNNGNCAYSESVTITVYDGVQFVLNAVNPDCGLTNGSISVTLTGGTSPFTYVWSDPSIGNTPVANGLASGTYHVTITDAEGCIGTTSQTLSSPASIAPTGLLISNPAACAGDIVSLTATGGAGAPSANLVYYEGSCGGTLIPNPANVVVSGTGNYYARYEDPCGVTTCAMATTSCLSFMVEITAILEGPYNLNTAIMEDNLRAASLLPFTEPYTALGYQHLGGGNESTVAAVFSVTGPNAIVDWVFVELRSASDITTPVATRSALIQADGDIVDMDGSSGVDFSGLGITPGDYWVIIRHKSHLDAMSVAPVYLGGATTAAYNFVASGAYFNGQITLGNGTQALYGGDVNQDGRINAADRSNIWNTRNQSGYIIEDITLNGYCGADDRSKAWNNRNQLSQIP